MAKSIVSHERLLSVLSYDPNTGQFVWRKFGGTRKIGDIAGYKTPRGYFSIMLDKHHYQSHRLAWFYMTGEWPVQIDHINQNPGDNRFCNLRNVTAAENNKNKKLAKTNKTGISGVMWSIDRKKWFVSIKVNKKAKTLGYFGDFFDACCVRKSEEVKNGFFKNHGRIGEITC